MFNLFKKNRKTTATATTTKATTFEGWKEINGYSDYWGNKYRVFVNCKGERREYKCNRYGLPETEEGRRFLNYESRAVAVSTSRTSDANDECWYVRNNTNGAKYTYRGYHSDAVKAIRAMGCYDYTLTTCKEIAALIGPKNRLIRKY